MKTTQRRIGISLGTLVLGGWMASATIASAQEAGPRPEPPQGPPPPRMEGAANTDPQAARMRMARGRVEELRRAGKHDEAQQLADRLRAAGAQRPQATRERNVRQPQVRGQVRERRNAATPADPAAQTRMRIQQLRQAADLLQAAGSADHAAKVRQEIERITTEARRAAEKEKARVDGEKEKARREAAEKADAGMREEMKKLRREVEELRAQLKKAKAEAKPKPDRGPSDGDRER